VHELTREQARWIDSSSTAGRRPAWQCDPRGQRLGQGHHRRRPLRGRVAGRLARPGSRAHPSL